MHPSAPQLLWVPPKRIGVINSSWNGADKDSTITLSGGNLVATYTAAGGSFGLVRGTVSKSSGKGYFELTGSGSGGVAGAAFGIATSSAGLTTGLGEDVAGWGYRTGLGTADIRNNAANAASGLTNPAMGDVIGIHVDFSALKIYFRLNGTNLGSMDPSAGTGGLTIAAGSWFPAFSGSNLSEAATLNVGATAFGASPVAGYSAWG